MPFTTVAEELLYDTPLTISTVLLILNLFGISTTFNVKFEALGAVSKVIWSPAAFSVYELVAWVIPSDIAITSPLNSAGESRAKAVSVPVLVNFASETTEKDWIEI